MRVAILGGGVAGLACAHYLAKGGHTPVVLETSGWLGQHGAPIEHDGLRLDGFSHAIRNSDTALCGLLGELGGRRARNLLPGDGGPRPAPHGRHREP